MDRWSRKPHRWGRRRWIIIIPPRWGRRRRRW